LKNFSQRDLNPAVCRYKHQVLLTFEGVWNLAAENVSEKRDRNSMEDFERFLLVRGKIGKCRSRMDRNVTRL